MTKSKTIKFISLIMCFVIVLGCAQIGTTAISQPNATDDTVTVSFLFAFFRSEPKLSFASIKGIFLHGREVKILGYSGSYVYVEDSNSETKGYIHYLLLNDKRLNIIQDYINVYKGASKDDIITINYDKDGILEWSVNQTGIVEVTKYNNRSLSVKGINPGTVKLTVKCNGDKDTCDISCIERWNDTDIETATAQTPIKVMGTPGKYYKSKEIFIPKGATITARGYIPSNSEYVYVSSGNIWGFINLSDFTSIKYVMTQYHYYDNGYKERFGSPVTKIQDYSSVLNDVMMTNFGLKVYSYVDLFASLADDCKTLSYGSVNKNNLSSRCPQTNNHNINSCLIASHIRDDMLQHKGNGNPTITKCIWTGHIMDSHKGDRSHSESTTYSIIFTTGNTVNADSYTNKTNSTVRRTSIYEIVHETSHQLSVPDHYCYGKTNTELCKNPNCELCYGSGALPDCIMGKVIYPTDTYDLYCEECATTIEKHLKDHH